MPIVKSLLEVLAVIIMYRNDQGIDHSAIFVNAIKQEVGVGGTMVISQFLLVLKTVLITGTIHVYYNSQFCPA